MDKPTKTGTITDISDARKKVGTAGFPGADEQTVQVGAGALKTGKNSEKRVRGKDKTPRKKRTDSNQLAFSPDDRARILAHNINVMRLGRVRDRNDPEEIREHIEYYYQSCIDHQVLPTVAGLALCLGIDRNTLWDWMDGRRGTIKNPEVVDTLKSVYSQINSQYEDLMTQGKIIPVAGIFLMKNNMGYKDQTDHVITAQHAEDPDTGELAARAGLLDDGQQH